MADEFKYKHRAGTAAQWAAPQDGPLLLGEIGVLLENGVPIDAKIGDGETAFADLPSLGGSAIGDAGLTRLATPFYIFETALGVWTDDAPARPDYEYPIVFVGVTDPTDPTNGIATPANLAFGDEWRQKTEFIA